MKTKKYKLPIIDHHDDVTEKELQRMCERRIEQAEYMHELENDLMIKQEADK